MPPDRASAPSNSPPAARVADQLHSAAIHLLRSLRRVDDETGLSAPRLSALSVVVFAGPLTLGDLASAEGVRPPTMTRLVTGLESDGLVARRSDPADARITRVTATARGRAVLARGRARRAQLLEAQLARLPGRELRTLGEAATLMEAIARALR